MKKKDLYCTCGTFFRVVEGTFYNAKNIGCAKLVCERCGNYELRPLDEMPGYEDEVGP